MHHLIKRKINEWANEDDGFFPDKPELLNAVSCESRDPLGNGKYETKYFSCTEWVNGEGFDISISTHNQVSKQVVEKMFSLATNDIDGILRCLEALNYFG